MLRKMGNCHDIIKGPLRCKFSLFLLAILISLLVLIQLQPAQFSVQNIIPNYRWIEHGNSICKSSPEVLKNIQYNDISTNINSISFQELYIIKRFGWSSPIVVEKYKLIFIQIEKVGCTQWKKLLQLIQNISNPFNTLGSIHDPKLNGLKYLMNYTDDKARSMLLDPSWTIATMVREPRARILSAYIHFSGTEYFKMSNLKTPTFREFLLYISSHSNEHWASQIRLPLWLYRHVIVGKIDNIQTFAEKILRRIGAWDQWGHKWGRFRNETVFSDVFEGENKTKLEANKRIKEFYTRELEDVVFDMFKKEYELFNFSCNYYN